MIATRSRSWSYAAGIAGCLLLGWFPFVRGERVPLLGLVDLGFHELGHLLTYPLPDVVTATMGSVAQVAVPLGLAAYFALVRRDLVGAGLCLAWAGASARDVAVYVADAPFQRLALIGGEHDWAFVLGPGHLDALDAAGTIAAVIRVIGALLVVAGVAACIRGLLRDRPRRVAQPTQPRLPSSDVEVVRSDSVGEGGLEPPRGCPHRNLNPARLPNSATRPGQGIVASRSVPRIPHSTSGRGLPMHDP